MTHPSPSPADSSESDNLPGGDSNFIGGVVYKIEVIKQIIDNQNNTYKDVIFKKT